MTPAIPDTRPPARPAGIYVHRPIPVRAMPWTGGNLAELCSFFGRVLEPVTLPGLGFCIPFTYRTGTLYAVPGDMVIADWRGDLSPLSGDVFAKAFRLKEEQPA